MDLLFQNIFQFRGNFFRCENSTDSFHLVGSRTCPTWRAYDDSIHHQRWSVPENTESGHIPWWAARQFKLTIKLIVYLIYEKIGLEDSEEERKSKIRWRFLRCYCVNIFYTLFFIIIFIYIILSFIALLSIIWQSLMFILNYFIWNTYCYSKKKKKCRPCSKISLLSLKDPPLLQ